MEHLDLYTDASGVAFAGVMQSQYFFGHWPEEYRIRSSHVKAGVSMAFLELYPIVVACHLFADKL